jgi:hypothetical protein
VKKPKLFFGMLRLLQTNGKVGEEKASSSSHYLRPRAKESASHGNPFAIFYCSRCRSLEHLTKPRC